MPRSIKNITTTFAKTTAAGLTKKPATSSGAGRKSRGAPVAAEFTEGAASVSGAVQPETGTVVVTPIPPELVPRNPIRGGPDDCYIEETDRALFEHKLRKIANDGRLAIDLHTDQLTRAAERGDDADAAVSLQIQREAAFATRRNAKMINAATVALKSIADHTYGTCEITDEPIGYHRLLAQPTTTLSMEAQETRETFDKQTRNGAADLDGLYCG